MSAFDDLDQAREDVEALLIDVLGSVLGEEVLPTSEGAPSSPLASARLAIHDETDDSYAVVNVRLGATLARVLASRMMFVADPEPDDVLDAVAELGNIAGGNVKSLLCQHARLSLPVSDISESADTGLAESHSGAVCVQAIVLGHVAELEVAPGADLDGLYWPPSTLDDALERQP